MAERITVNSNKPVSIKDNLISHKRKTDFRSDDSPVNRILYLQRTIGNQAVQRLVKSRALQAKLRIGPPRDAYEQEADQVADAVMRMPEPGVQQQVGPEEEEEEVLQTKPLVDQITPLVQRQVEEEEEMLQAKSMEDSTSEVPHGLESQINAIKGGGRPLAESERAYFEPRFGYDFGQVRMHTDIRAAETAQAVNAQAFTVGNDVVFGIGKYSPHTAQGKSLLSHELTHVIQQGTDLAVHESVIIGESVSRAEREAEYAMTQIIPGRPISVSNREATGTIQRDDADDDKRRKWDEAYRTKRARPGALPYEKYKAKIGQQGEAEKYAPELKAASKWGGTKLRLIAMTREEFGQILKPELPQAAQAHKKRLDDYLPHVNRAFEVMEIDTVEAQADYLAHAAGESGTLAKLSEVGAGKRPYAPFKGRGPVQVTWEHGYVQTLAYLEMQAKRLAALAEEKEKQLAEEVKATGIVNPWPGDSDTEPIHAEIRNPWLEDEARRTHADASLTREAFDAITADITEAANPKYAFLFSAAYMHMAGGVRSSARLGTQENFPGNELEDRWVTGRRISFETTLAKAQEKGNKAVERDMLSAINRAKVKRDTYARAVSVLSKKSVQ